MNADSPAVKIIPNDTTASRQVTRRRLFTAHFPLYPGFVQGKRVGLVSAHSKMGGFVPRKERRKMARAFAAGGWGKRNG